MTIKEILEKLKQDNFYVEYKAFFKYPLYVYEIDNKVVGYLYFYLFGR